MKYRNKPVVIEAIQFTGTNFSECEQFIGSENYDTTLNYPNIITLEGVMKVSEGDFIIKGVAGEFYPCKPDIFKQTYEPVVEDLSEENYGEWHRGLTKDLMFNKNGAR